MAESDLGLKAEALLGDARGVEATGVSSLDDALDVLDDGEVTPEAAATAPKECLLDVTDEDREAEDLAREAALEAEDEASG